jgi:hypothetical protein
MAFTSIITTILAFLGFFSSPLPVNDNLQHFFCFMIATGVFYFIFDVEEYVSAVHSIGHLITHSANHPNRDPRDARRIWFWRNLGLIITSIVCFFLGGIMSEFVQSMLPVAFCFESVLANITDLVEQHKEFQTTDIIVCALGEIECLTS